MENEESLGDQEMCMSEDISKNQQLNPSADHFQACQELHDNDPGGGGGTWVFFGWVCSARDSKLAPRSKNNFP